MAILIRKARFGDIPGVWELMIEAHARSRYAGFCELSERRAKAAMMTAIQRNGGQNEGSTFFAVAEQNERLDGCIIGLLTPFYHVLATMEATDLFWYARSGAHPKVAARLLKAMHLWAWKSPHVSIIRQGNSDAIVDRAASGRLLSRAGMNAVGNIYEKERVA